MYGLIYIDKVAYWSQFIGPQYTLNSLERNCEKPCAFVVSVMNIFSGNSLLGMTITEAGRSQNPKVFMQCNKGHKICKVYLRQPKINFIPWSTDCLSKYGENNIGNSWWLKFFYWYNSIVCTGKQPNEIATSDHISEVSFSHFLKFPFFSINPTAPWKLQKSSRKQGDFCFHVFFGNKTFFQEKLVYILDWLTKYAMPSEECVFDSHSGVATSFREKTLII